MDKTELKALSVDFGDQFAKRTEDIKNFFNLHAVNEKTMIEAKKMTGELQEDISLVRGQEIKRISIVTEPYDIGKIEFEAVENAVHLKDIQEVNDTIPKEDKYLLGLVEQRIEDTLMKRLNNLADKEGTVTDAINYKAALAKARGKLESVDGFKGASAIAFVNTDDYFEYLGDANLTTQTEFGMTYVKDFLGYDAIFYTTKVAQGDILVTGQGNLNLSYVPASGKAYGSIGLVASSNDLVAVKHYVDDKAAEVVTQVHFAIESYPQVVDAIVKVTLGEPVEAPESDGEAGE